MVTSSKYARAGLWQASASKSNKTVPRMVKNIPHGCGVIPFAESLSTDFEAVALCGIID